MARRNETTAGDPSAQTQPAKKASSNHPVVTVYLIVYNLLSSIAWGHILFRLSVHMLTAPVPSSTSYFASIKFYKSPLPSVLLAVLNSLAPSLVPYAERASGAFAVIGAETKWVQSVAVLEIAHAALGFVRSPTGMTAAQVSGRLVLLWGVADRFATARANPLYASMVFAWSLTEVIRYLFYVSSLVASPPYALLWARYTTFYALYPIGGVSEALIVFFTLPWKNWGLSEWVRGALFLVWLPGLYVLYTHMLGQRRRVLGDGKGKTLGSKKTR